MKSTLQSIFSLICLFQLVTTLSPIIRYGLSQSQSKYTIMNFEDNVVEISNNPSFCGNEDTKWWWARQKNFIDANSDIYPYKYALGYRFASNLSNYHGRIGIYFQTLNNTNVERIIINSKYNIITSLSIGVIQNGTIIDINDNDSIYIKHICALESNPDNLMVRVNKKLNGLQNYVLNIEFNGVPSIGMNGIYKSEYTNQIDNNINNITISNNAIESIISTHFEPQYARQAFPCFDEPSMKAKFSIYLTHLSILKSYSNMPVEKIVKNDDETKTVYFEETPPMSTYLVAFTINNYSIISTISDSVNKVNVSVLLPAHMIEKGQFALDIASNALKLFETLTSIPYALKKIDLIGIPSFEAGAMENWGLITFRLTQMIYDNESVSIKAKEYVAITVVHEISHQWFGNLVTMKKWTDIWLNEGFATFMESYGVDRLFPSWKVKIDERITYTDIGIGYDQLNVTHPISLPDDYVDDVKTLFDPISYTKSGAILRMLMDVIGEEAFWRVISKYLNDFAYDSSTSNDLWNTLNKEVKIPYIYEMVHSWTTNTGLPLVTVSLSTDSGKQNIITISQTRFIMTNNLEKFDQKSSEKWIIPISYAVKYDNNDNTVKTGILWLNDTIQQFTMDSKIKWIQINKDRLGFFISQYDERGWNEIIQTLKTNPNELSFIDKITLLSDSMRLNKNGMLSFNIPLKLLKLLMNDMDYYIQMSCIGHLNAIGKLIDFNKSIYNSYKKFFTIFLHQRYYDLMNPLLVLNYTDRQKTMLSNTITSMCVEYNCSFVTGHVINLLRLWEHDDTIKVDPGLFTSVLESAALYGNLTDIQILEDRYNVTDNPHLKRKLLYALTQVTNLDRLKKYLNDSLYSDFVSNQDYESFISSIASNHVGTGIVWDFIRQNWNSIIKKLVDAEMIVSSLLPSVATKFKSTSMIKEVNEFYSANQKTIYPKDYALTIETIKLNADWSIRVMRTLTSDLNNIH